MKSLTQSKTLVERTYEVLLEAICTGDLSPGERLNQDKIAARLNVSRQPVNSAIAILKTNGFAKDTGRRSAVVTALSSSQFTDIFEFRAVIEPFAVTRAAEKLPETAKVEAANILRIGRQAVANADMKALLQADADFHQMIYRWSGNRVIENSMQVNWQHIRRSMAEVLRHPEAARPSWDAHERIADALLAGDAEAASSEMDTHIRLAILKFNSARSNDGG